MLLFVHCRTVPQDSYALHSYLSPSRLINAYSIVSMLKYSEINNYHHSMLLASLYVFMPYSLIGIYVFPLVRLVISASNYKLTNHFSNLRISRDNMKLIFTDRIAIDSYIWWKIIMINWSVDDQKLDNVSHQVVKL